MVCPDGFNQTYLTELLDRVPGTWVRVIDKMCTILCAMSTADVQRQDELCVPSRYNNHQCRGTRGCCDPVFGV
jgi:hypothetical protein